MRNLITIVLLFVGLAAVGQIPINTNFDVSTPNPIDGRMTIPTLDDTSTIASLYAGLLTVTEDTGEVWLYNGMKWVPNSKVFEGITDFEKTEDWYSSKGFRKVLFDQEMFMGVSLNEPFMRMTGLNLINNRFSNLTLSSGSFGIRVVDPRAPLVNESFLSVSDDVTIEVIKDSSGVNQKSILTVGANSIGINFDAPGVGCFYKGFGSDYSNFQQNSLAPKALTISGLEGENISVNADQNSLTITELGTLNIGDTNGVGVDWAIQSASTDGIPTRLYRDDTVGISYFRLQNGVATIFDQTVSQAYTLDAILRGEIQTGTAAPTSTPEYTGQIFIDTATPAIYMAAGTSSSSDWLQISN